MSSGYKLLVTRCCGHQLQVNCEFRTAQLPKFVTCSKSYQGKAIFAFKQKEQVVTTVVFIYAKKIDNRKVLMLSQNASDELG